jgi:hypothetical protein
LQEVLNALLEGTGSSQAAFDVWFTGRWWRTKVFDCDSCREIKRDWADDSSLVHKRESFQHICVRRKLPKRTDRFFGSQSGDRDRYLATPQLEHYNKA